MRTALRQLFEKAIDTAYHSGGMTNTGMVRQVFGNEKTPSIFKRLKRLCGTPSLQELYQDLLRLHEPIDCNQPVYVMLCTTEEVQMFLMAHTDGDLEISDVNLISYTVIKPSKCGGLYTNPIDRCQKNIKTDKKIWENICQHLISELENVLAEGGGTTLFQEGCGTAFNATEATMEKSTITKSIFCYTEWATVVEGKVQLLEDRLNQLEIGKTQPPHQIA